mgnify:FL=1
MKFRIEPCDKAFCWRQSISNASATTLRAPSGYLIRRLVLQNRDATNFVSCKLGITGTINLTDGYQLNDANQTLTGTTGIDQASGLGTFTVAARVITGASAASPCEITVVGHGYITGDKVAIAGIVGDMGDDVLNGNTYTVTRTGADTFTVVADTTGKTYTSDGTATQVWTVNAYSGLFLKESSATLTTNAAVYEIVRNTATVLYTKGTCATATGAGLVRLPDFKVYAGDVFDLPVAASGGIIVQADTAAVTCNIIMELDRVA